MIVMGIMLGFGLKMVAAESNKSRQKDITAPFFGLDPASVDKVFDEKLKEKPPENTQKINKNSTINHKNDQTQKTTQNTTTQTIPIPVTETLEQTTGTEKANEPSEQSIEAQKNNQQIESEKGTQPPKPKDEYLRGY